MQKDFAAMAQGQQTPTPSVQVSVDEVKQVLPSMEQMGESGYPTGESKQDIKQRILMAFEQLGLMELYNTPEKQQEFATQLEQLVQAIMNKDKQGLQQNPLMKVYQQFIEANMKQGQQQAAPQQQEAPKDFASMVPPGGGMIGR